MTNSDYFTNLVKGRSLTERG